ncbi:MULTISPECIES: DUF2878 family protein [unclassified Pseudomonas]|uniref:DUF2878 family protein n=1 Tax=unclassified Pseudomonas TaxID=196821 RepID=UPI00244C90BE|nr:MULTISPECIES: DUF2878 family protein [unclassified Pseudomonas]MDG9925987.1 DUF2878 domain-containing protein [Pseudomonas sp. GD04045]MDH0033627.1 DUF2878 domain-containing protein [Pseudomonas sp. GD04019]
MNRALLLNAGLFQLGWWACVLSPQRPWLLAFALLILAAHLRWLAQPGEWRGLLRVTLFGAALDSALAALGLFDFSLPPLWLVLLWALLACTLRHSLAWSARPHWRAALLGALAAPPAYIGGATLAGVGLPLGIPLTWLLLALLWAAALPLSHRLAGN